MKILIIEDEPATASRLQKMILEIDPGSEVLDIIDSIETAVQWLRTHTEPDLMFLDIHLADGLSFNIFKEVEVNSPVIFTTAYDQYALQAFKVNSIDYLLKPIKKTELAESLKKFHKLETPFKADYYSRLSELLNPPGKIYLKRLMVRLGMQIKVVDISQIAYFYIDQKIVYLATKKNDRYPLDLSLDQLESQLDPKAFYRVNRAFIISFEAIDSMISYSKSRIKIRLKPPCELETISSTDRSSDFREWLKGK